MYYAAPVTFSLYNVDWFMNNFWFLTTEFRLTICVVYFILYEVARTRVTEILLLLNEINIK